MIIMSYFFYKKMYKKNNFENHNNGDKNEKGRKK